jgi:hypothetical protein
MSTEGRLAMYTRATLNWKRYLHKVSLDLAFLSSTLHTTCAEPGTAAAMIAGV